MTPGPEKSEFLDEFQKLQKEHLEIVLSLTQANSEVLLARQQASGIEFAVQARKQDHTEKGKNASSDAVLSEINAQDAQAKQKLAAAEQRVEEIENQLSAVAVRIAEL